MKNDLNMKGAWFVYDGDCPLCSSAAHAIRIKAKFGSLHLVNAREETEHPLLSQINDRKISLDEGMIIYADGTFHHGKQALKFMARQGAPKTAFSIFCKGLFWSDTLSSLTYPWMRGVRNYLLRRKKANQIDNLNSKEDPFFKPIFGGDWKQLPPVLKKHYAARPYRAETTLAIGTLDVMCRGPFKYLSGLFKIMGGVPPYNEKNVPATVRFYCQGQVPAFYFDREFKFKVSPAYSFKSRMMPLPNGDLVEVMRFGLGWRLNYSWEEERVRLNHRGYSFYVFGHHIPLPLTHILGKGYGEEWAIDENRFEMKAMLIHPIWGKLYEYTGQFEMMDKPP
ncbi:MAG: DUF4166 domain-containing protein [Sneathiella sp.]